MIEQVRFATAITAHYDDEFAEGVKLALSWILGEQLIPPIQIPERTFFD